ncbi:MAG: hypothetical protein CL468_03610 [Acidimicrobiaceae bacterium]|nr:hypothetical protein [Acidimicrobiaceae bacterium]
MDRLIILVVSAAAAATLAFLVQRRRPNAPIRTGWTVPDQLDRRDFAHPDAPWLVAVFTSASCDSCAAVVDVAKPLASDAVAVDVVEIGEKREVHDRYAVDAVPMVLLVDALGVVRDHHLGPVSAAHLWGSLAELREPGSTPDGCDAGH